MKFSEFSKYLQRLESTTKRLEMIDIITELINKLPNEYVDTAIYLACGYLKAPFKGLKFNIADKMMINILSNAFSSIKDPHIKPRVQKLYEQKGDLGNVAYELATRTRCDFDVKTVHNKLKNVAAINGTGSQELKVKKMSELLRGVDKLSAKYITRITLGITRLGFTETTITESLARLAGDKKLKKKIEGVYNIHPDIGLITKKIKMSGIKGLDEISIETGVPLLSQKAQRIGGGIKEVINKMGTIWAEFKFDGTRVQLHIDKNKKIDSKKTSLLKSDKENYLIKTFTRNLEETTHQYPDLADAAKKYIDATSAIVDGEAIGFDKKTGEFLPFQEIMQRKRKHGISDMVKEVPLKYFVFDLLYLNGKPLIDKTLKERRAALHKVIKKNDVIIIDDHIETDDTKTLDKYFETAKRKSLEGLIAKKPGDAYQAGARSYSWVKIKKADETLMEDSVDCVILGYYFGKGARSKLGIGGLLVGVYEPKNDSFKTVSKIGTGFTEDAWIKIKQLCDKYKVSEKPKNVVMDKIFKPETFVSPRIVIEIGADEISASQTHTAGYALRFPRFLKVRNDKNPSEATTVEEIKQMHKNQKRGLYSR